MNKELIETILTTPLYELRKERWRMVEGEPWVEIEAAYNRQGDYIGDGEAARFYCDQLGIAPERADAEHSVCSIGFSSKDQRWYGWSHRAYYGFGVGDVVKEGSCCAMSGWINDIDPRTGERDTKPLPVGFTAETLADARRMAIAFAASVS